MSRWLVWLNFLPRIQQLDTGESACPCKNNQLSQTRRGPKRSFDRRYSGAIIPAGNQWFLVSYLAAHVCFCSHPPALERYKLPKADG